MLRQKTWNHIKCSIKITKGSKKVEDENRGKKQGQQVENSTHTVDFNTTILISL